MSFWATHKRSRFRRVPIAHAQFTCKHILSLFAYDGCIWGAYQILVNPTSGGSRPLGGKFLPTCTCLYLPYTRNCAIMEAWLPFMTCRICILRTLLSGWSSLSWYMQIVEPLQSLQEWPTWPSWSSLMNTPPPSPWDDNLYWMTNIINGNSKKHQSLLLRGVGSGPGPSSPPSCFLSWHGD